jgi:hypothetical protein
MADEREPAKLPNETCRFQFVTDIDGPIHQYSGSLRVAVYDQGLFVQWYGEYDWYKVAWWEISKFAEIIPPRLREDLQFERELTRERAIIDLIGDIKKNPQQWGIEPAEQMVVNG